MMASTHPNYTAAEMALRDNLLTNVRENRKRRLVLCIRQQGGLIEHKKI